MSISLSYDLNSLPSQGLAYPRILVSALSSHAGKTWVCGALAAGLMAWGAGLMARGVKESRTDGLDQAFTVDPYKVGPDRMDLHFLDLVTGQRGDNLDELLWSEEALLARMGRRARMSLQDSQDNQDRQLRQARKGGHLAIIEGVMGLLDGSLGEDRLPRGSSARIAALTRTPVILVLRPESQAQTLLAALLGAQNLTPELSIQAYLLNGVSPSYGKTLATYLTEQTGLPCLGCLDRFPDLGLTETRKGVIMEKEAVAAWQTKVAAALRDRIDWEALLAIAHQAPPLPGPPAGSMGADWPSTSSRDASSQADNSQTASPQLASLPQGPRRAEAGQENIPSPYLSRSVRVGISVNPLTANYFQADLQAMEDRGWTLVYFDPARQALPPNLDLVYLAGDRDGQLQEANPPFTAFRQLFAPETWTPAAPEADPTGTNSAAPDPGNCEPTSTDPLIVAFGESLLHFQDLLGQSFVIAPKRPIFGYWTLEAQRDTLLLDRGDQVTVNAFTTLTPAPASASTPAFQLTKGGRTHSDGFSAPDSSWDKYSRQGFFSCVEFPLTAAPQVWARLVDRVEAHAQCRIEASEGRIMGAWGEARLEYLLRALALVSKENPKEAALRALVEQNWNQICKPIRSLGQLEDLFAKLIVARGEEDPRFSTHAAYLFGADNGVVYLGVSQSDQTVSAQVVRNACKGGNALSILSEDKGVDLHLVNLGLSAYDPREAWDDPAYLKIENRIVHPLGTMVPLTHEKGPWRPEDVRPMMSYDEVLEAIWTGFSLIDQTDSLADLYSAGEMGIGNTSTSALVLAALLGLDPEDLASWIDVGSGLSRDQLSQKKGVLTQLYRTYCKEAPGRQRALEREFAPLWEKLLARVDAEAGARTVAGIGERTDAKIGERTDAEIGERTDADKAETDLSCLLQGAKARCLKLLDLLAFLGGYDIGAIVGFYLGAAYRQRPVLLDGQITEAAALAAFSLHPRIAKFLVATHRPRSVLAQKALEVMGLPPLLDLSLALGEGTGSLFLLDILRQTSLLYHQMPRFETGKVEAYEDYAAKEAAKQDI